MGTAAYEADAQDPRRERLRSAWQSLLSAMDQIAKLLDLDIPRDPSYRGPTQTDCGAGFLPDSTSDALWTRSASKQPVFDPLEGYRRHWDRLLPKQRAALEMTFIEGLSQEQIGERMGIGRKAVNGLLRRAQRRRASLEKELREEAIRLMRRDVDI